MAQVRLNFRCGFVSSSGQFIIKPIYQYVMPFNEGFAAVCVNWKWGFIDMNGKIVVPIKFKNAKSFLNGIAFVQNWDENRWIEFTLDNIPDIPNIKEEMGKPFDLSGELFFVTEA